MNARMCGGIPLLLREKNAFSKDGLDWSIGILDLNKLILMIDN